MMLRAIVTFVALLSIFAAFDDITTDNATAFPLEYTILAVSAAWLLFVSFRLMREHHRVLAVVSFLALAGALWGQRAIGPGITPGWWPQYVVTTTAYVWFWAIAFVLLWQAVRGRSGYRRHAV